MLIGTQGCLTEPSVLKWVLLPPDVINKSGFGTRSHDQELSEIFALCF